MELLYEGKAKQIFSTDKPYTLHVKYKDDATAFNGEKKDTLAGKGRLNNLISSKLFTALNAYDIPHHFIEQLSETEQLVKAVEIIPLEVVVRNVTTGSLAKRLGLADGLPIQPSIVEFYYKDDELGDPLITEDHIRLMKAASDDEVHLLKNMALQINEILTGLFDGVGIRLVDFKLEFGRLKESGQVVLADEISPDTCRLWDKETNEKLDKDVFRQGLGDLPTAYEKLLKRLEGLQ